MVYTSFKNKPAENKEEAGWRIIKNSAFILSSKGIRVVSSVFILIAVARYLSVQQYGEFTFVVTFVSSIMALSYFGIQRVLIRDIAKDKANASHYFGIAIRLRSYLTAFAVMILLISIQFMELSSLTVVAVIVAIISEFFITFSSLSKAVFQGFEKMIYEPTIILIFYIMLSISTVAVIYFDMGFLWLFIAIAFSNSIQFFATAYILLTRFIRPSFDIKKTVLRKFFKDSSLVGVGVFFCQNLSRINVLMLKWLGNLEHVAFFQVPHNIVLQIQMLPASLVAALFPLISNLQHNEPAKALEIYEKILRYTFTSSFFIAMFFSIFSHEIIDTVFGSKYENSVAVLTVISWAIIPMSMEMALNCILVAMDKQRYIAFYSGIILLMNSLAALVFIPLYGYMGGAFLALFFYTCLSLFSLYFVLKSGLSVHLYKIVTKTVTAGLFSAATVLSLRANSLFVAAFTGMIVYFTILLITNMYKKEELLFAASSIKQVFNKN